MLHARRRFAVVFLAFGLSLISGKVAHSQNQLVTSYFNDPFSGHSAALWGSLASSWRATGESGRAGDRPIGQTVR